MNNLSKKSNNNFADLNSDDVDIKKILSIIMLRKKIILGMFFLSLILGSVFLSMQTPKYTSTAVILISSNEKNIVDYDTVVPKQFLDEPAIEAEVDILRSRSLARKIVDKLDLTNDPDFMGYYSESEPTYLSRIYSYFTKNKTDDDSAKVVNNTYTDDQIEEIKLARTIDRFLAGVSIKRKTLSRTIDVSFTSESPQKAQRIANAIADEYLVNQMSEKFEATKRANDWLNQKILSLQKKLRESEFAVQVFKQDNDLIEMRDDTTVDSQQVLELNTQLILAKTDLAQAEARLASARRSINSSTEVLKSGLIQSLRQQESLLLTKKSDLESRYGSLHPKIVNINAELRELERNINLEISKIKSGLNNEVNIARARVKSLNSSLSEMQGKVGVSTKAKVRLSELIRERDANSLLYEAFLSRAKQTSQSKDLDQSHARIISKAEIPTYPSSPKKRLILIISLFLGLVLGFGLVFIIEMLDNVFSNGKQIEQLAGVSSLGVLPNFIKKGKSATDYIINNKSSYCVELIRSILTSIYFSNPDKPPKTILVTSSVPSEGKTTFTISLATISAMTGKKVLIIDCDMKKPSVASKLDKKDIKLFLGDYLAGAASQSDITNIDEKTGVHFISSSSNTSNSQDLLGSQKMKNFLKDMSSQYDLVIVDSPPLMAVSDALIISRIVDTVAYMVKWNKTPRNVALTAIRKLFADDVKIAGAVLSIVNLDKYSKKSYGDVGYYYSNYKDHYAT